LLFFYLNLPKGKAETNFNQKSEATQFLKQNMGQTKRFLADKYKRLFILQFFFNPGKIAMQKLNLLTKCYTQQYFLMGKTKDSRKGEALISSLFTLPKCRFGKSLTF